MLVVDNEDLNTCPDLNIGDLIHKRDSGEILEVKAILGKKGTEILVVDAKDGTYVVGLKGKLLPDENFELAVCHER